MRKASVKRTTKETAVEVAIDLDGEGRASIATGIGFLDHMLDLLARHSRIDIDVKAEGDLHIDHHHTTEEHGRRCQNDSSGFKSPVLIQLVRSTHPSLPQLPLPSPPAARVGAL